MKDDKDWRERMGGNYPEDLPDTTAPRHLSVSINLEIIMFPEVQIANARTPPPLRPSCINVKRGKSL